MMNSDDELDMYLKNWETRFIEKKNFQTNKTLISCNWIYSVRKGKNVFLLSLHNPAIINKEVFKLYRNVGMVS